MLGSVGMAEIYNESVWRLFNELDTSLDPARPEQLDEIADPFLGKGHHIRDLGCRDARHLIELVRRYAATGVGVDPVPWCVQRARAAVVKSGLDDRIAIRLGSPDGLVEKLASFDTVWCGDVIEVLPDLATALSDMHRILRPGGHMIIVTNLVGGSIDDAETVTIHEPLGNVVANQVESDLEPAFAGAGFGISIKHVIRTAWREQLEKTTTWCPEGRSGSPGCGAPATGHRTGTNARPGSVLHRLPWPTRRPVPLNHDNHESSKCSACGGQGRKDLRLRLPGQALHSAGTCFGSELRHGPGRIGNGHAVGCAGLSRRSVGRCGVRWRDTFRLEGPHRSIQLPLQLPRPRIRPGGGGPGRLSLGLPPLGPLFGPRELRFRPGQPAAQSGHLLAQLLIRH